MVSAYEVEPAIARGDEPIAGAGIDPVTCQPYHAAVILNDARSVYLEVAWQRTNYGQGILVRDVDGLVEDVELLSSESYYPDSRDPDDAVQSHTLPARLGFFLELDTKGVSPIQ